MAIGYFLMLFARTPLGSSASLPSAPGTGIDWSGYNIVTDISQIPSRAENVANMAKSSMHDPYQSMSNLWNVTFHGPQEFGMMPPTHDFGQLTSDSSGWAGGPPGPDMPPADFTNYNPRGINKTGPGGRGPINRCP